MTSAPRPNHRGTTALAWVLCVSGAMLAAGLQGGAQEGAATTAPADPRIGLKAGLRDAGKAAHNMEFVTNLPKPEGFFDPKAPGGEPTGPERPRTTTPEAEVKDTGALPEPPDPVQPPQRPNALGFAFSDLAFQGDHLFFGSFHGFNTYDIEDPRKARLVSSVVCPGGQGDVSVHGNLLIMSVEQTRGRLDCGTQGVQDPVSAERFRGIRIFDITDVRKPKQVAAVQTCRGSHTHTLVPDPKDKANLYVYGSGTSTVRSAGRARRLLVEGSEGRSEHRALQYRRHPDSDRRTRQGADREPAAHLCRPEDRRDRGAVAWRRLRAGDPALARHQPVPRHHGLSGDRPGGGRVRRQRHPPGHLRSGQSRPPGPGVRQEFRVLAFGDVQQRRLESDLHRRMGRRHASALPGERPADLGRRRDLRHRRSEDTVRRLLQAAGAAERAGELRRAQRLAHSRAGARHHGPGVVSGRRLGLRLHRFDEACRDRVLRSRPDRRRTARHRRILVDLLVATATSTGPRSRAASTCSS